MEPMVSVAYFDDAGRLAIHTHSQCLYFQLGQLAAIFNLPMSRIRYKGGVVGGGFGGKVDVIVEPIATLAAIRGSVRLWARRPEVAEAITRTRRNPDYLDDVELPPAVVATGACSAGTSSASSSNPLSSLSGIWA